MSTESSQQTPKKTLTTCVFERIDAEQVCPRPRWWFRSRECVVWTLWLLSVVIGALAVAVTLYTLLLRQYALYEVTHDSFWWSVAVALPYIWFVAFGSMVVFAVYNIRHTKYGYRYPLWQIIFSSVLVSMVTGFGLQLAGIGHLTDQILGKNMGMYPSQQKYERTLWQQPEQGRLVAVMMHSTEDANVIVMRDINNERWVIDISDASDVDQVFLQSGKFMKILGVMIDRNTKQFMACGSTPWHFDKPVSRAELYTERDAFWRRIERHRESKMITTSPAERSMMVVTSQGVIASCADMPLWHKVPAR